MTWRGWEKFTPPAHSQAVPLRKTAKGKYGAVQTSVGRVTFASKREADRYLVLCDDRDKGLITDLELQPQYPLHVITPEGTKVVIGRYIADFRYRRNGELVIEDAKGMKTETYRWKKKHVQNEYGITILET